MKDRRTTLLNRIANKVRAHFVFGILVVVPLAATILILLWIFNSVDHILGRLVALIAGRPIAGVGFIATVLLIYIAGMITSSDAGRRLVAFSEQILDRIPVVRSIYCTVKEMLDGFSGANRSGFLQVVLIEYPRKGVMSIAFVTKEFSDSSGAKLYNVFVPTSPNPTSGFLRIVKSEEVTKVGMSVDEAFRMLVSFGRVAPENVGEKLVERDAATNVKET